MQSPLCFASLQEVLNWYYNPNSHTQQLSGKELGVTVTYRQSNVLICDLKIKIRGYDEEKIFLENPFIRLNIRRGNSILITFNPELCKNPEQITSEPLSDTIPIGEIISAEWVRRGLLKFFDISLSLLKKEVNSTEKPQSDKETSLLSHQIIFNPVIEALNSRKIVEIYQTEKANGENVQVSYILPLDKWIISSKNCSIAVSSIDEIENYSGIRTSFAKHIALAWFRMLEKVNNLQKLKNWLKSRTMVGEYVGNKDFEHIVKYTQETIKFYAVVDNNSGFSCLPVLEAFFWFRVFSIETVKVKKIGRFEKAKIMFEELERVFEEISIEDIDNGGEGSVLYFVSSNYTEPIGQLEDQILLASAPCFRYKSLVKQISQQQVTLSLGKIKTLEYRLFRKIREKIKHLTLQMNSFEIINRKFESECKNLCAGFDITDRLPYFLQYFEKVAAKRLESLKNPENLSENLNKLINKNYPAVFLETSWLANIPPDMIKRSLPLNFVSNAYSKGFTNENIYHNCLNPENMTEVHEGRYYIVGYGEEDESKFIEKTCQFTEPEHFPQELLKFNRKQDIGKMQGYIHEYFEAKRVMFRNFEYPISATVKFYSAIDEAKVIKDIKDDLGITDKKINKVIKKKRQKGLVLLPIMIPGAGKSYLRRHLFSIFKQKKESIKFELLDCDHIRNQIIKKLGEKMPNCSFESKFDQSSKELKGLVVNLIQKTLDESKLPAVFYIDRNYSHKSISDFLSGLKSLEHDITVVGISPYSYSMDFLATCLKRVLSRKNHLLSEDSSPLYKIKVVLEIFKKLNKKSVQACKAQLDGCIVIPMFNESEQFLAGYQKNTLDLALENPENEERLAYVLDMLQGYTVKEKNFETEITERIQEALVDKGFW